MTEIDSPPKRTVAARRRLLLLVLYAAFLGLLVEGGGFALLWKVRGSMPNGEWVRGELRALAGSPANEDVELDERSLHRGPDYLRREVLHPYVGYLPKPLGRHRGGDGVWLNGPEFYAPDSPIFDDAEDVVVVGITGGSVAGIFARASRTELAEQLQLHPRFEGKTVRFAILAFGGFKQPQQLMSLSFLLALGGHLDVLVNIDGFNEVALHSSGNERKGVAPVFPRDWYFRSFNGEVSAPLLGELAYLRRARADWARDALESPFGWSWARRAAWKIRDRSLGRMERLVEDSLRDYVPPDNDPSHAAPSLGGQALDELVTVWRESSLQLDRLCRANGIDYFHVLQPNQYVPGTKDLTAKERAEAVDPDHRYGREAAAGYAALLPAGDELVEAGVRFADMTLVFADVEETLYIDDCCHFNKLGNDILARAIGEFVLANTD